MGMHEGEPLTSAPAELKPCPVFRLPQADCLHIKAETLDTQEYTSSAYPIFVCTGMSCAAIKSCLEASQQGIVRPDFSTAQAWTGRLQVMTGHHKEITSLAVHPSGKLALTTSRDSTLRIWDLIKGRCSYHNVLPAIAETVCFSPSGTLYALQTGSQVTVHDIGQERGLVATMQHSQRVLCMAWHTDDLLLTGIETGSIHVWDVKSGTEVGQCVQAHRARIKGLVVHHTSGLPSNAQGSAVTARTSQQKDVMVASAASDGMVKTWRFDPQGGSDCLQLDSELSTGARLTCLCLVKPVSMGKDTDLAHKRLKAKQRKALAAASKTSSKGLPVPLKKGGVQKQQTQKPKPKLEAEVDLQKGGVAHDGVVDFTAEAKGKGSHQISASQASTRTSSQQPKKRNRR